MISANRPLAHLEAQAQTLQPWQRNSDHGTAPLDCVGKVRRRVPPTAAPETRLLVPPPPSSPGGWKVSGEVSEKRRGRQTAEQSQISSHGHLPCSLWRGGPLGPQAGHRPLSRLDLEMKEKRRHHCQEMNGGRAGGAPCLWSNDGLLAMMGRAPLPLPGGECREGWLESSELNFRCVSFHPDPSADPPSLHGPFGPHQGPCPS